MDLFGLTASQPTSRCTQLSSALLKRILPLPQELHSLIEQDLETNISRWTFIVTYMLFFLSSIVVQVCRIPAPPPLKGPSVKEAV